MSQADIEAAKHVRERYERESVGPLWVDILLGMPDLGPIVICGVEATEEVNRVLRAIRQGNFYDHIAQWVGIKQSYELTSEYLSFGLQIDWKDLDAQLVLFFPASEYMGTLKLFADGTAKAIGIQTHKSLEDTMVIDGIPNDPMKDFLALLEASR